MIGRKQEMDELRRLYERNRAGFITAFEGFSNNLGLPQEESDNGVNMEHTDYDVWVGT